MSEPKTLPKIFDHETIEKPIYQRWLEAGAFDGDPDSRPPDERYVIMMPLPNVTGALHMGHAMDNVMQDLLIRWHRMQGDNTLWMPGTDHAGIATQAVVEKRLKELEGKTRHDVGREGLLERIWSWKDEYQARIIRQQQAMGCSCDWRRQRFTMDSVCTRAVRHAFFRLFADGLIYQGRRMINWDVALQTSVSDDELEYKTVDGHFWHLRYPVIDPQPGEPEAVVVATTRPETMLGDTAVAVHPDPEGELGRVRQKLTARLEAASAKERPALEEQLAEVDRRRRELLPELLRLAQMARDGRQVLLPLQERPIPLILDEWAKPELGSGCVKITPAHDPNDYEVWQRHKDEIDTINLLQPDGTLNEAAGAYADLERFEARRRVVADLEAQGLLAAVEARQVEVAHSDRSKTAIEPYLSDQWFIRMEDVPGGVEMAKGTGKDFHTPGLVQAVIDTFESRRVVIHPERYTDTVIAWLSEKRPWPISRQLWWGHRIPVWTWRGAWGEAQLAALAPLFAADAATVRLRLPEREESVTLAGPEGPQGVTPRPEEAVAVQVCLLDDDPELTAALAAAGYQQDPDVLDTWFSSALWPFSTLGWPDPESAEVEPGQPLLGAMDGRDDCLSYYYPGSCLVTGRDILTLWIARMVLMGLYNLGDIPFTDVFVHANILDGKGERMSKSKGNGIDPEDLIERYGTDAMRFVLADMQTGSQDIRLPVTALCPSCGHHNDLAETAHGETDHGPNIFTYLCGKELDGSQRPDSCGTEFDVLGTMPGLPSARLVSDRFDSGRAFCTKLWNSARFAFMNLEEVPHEPRDLATLAIEDRWILHQVNRTVAEVQQALADYNPSAAVNAARELFWGSLCDWYLELIKARVRDGGGEDGAVARQVLAYCLDQVLRLFHPFVPFITEYLWGELEARVPQRGLGGALELTPSEQLITARWPVARPELEAPVEAELFAQLQELTRAVREIRNTLQVPWSRSLPVTLKASAEEGEAIVRHQHVLQQLAAVEAVHLDPDAVRPKGAAAKVVGGLQLFLHDVIDEDAERQRLEKELAEKEQAIAGAEKKLANENFVSRAPEHVVDAERQRLATYQAAAQALRRELERLS